MYSNNVVNQIFSLPKARFWLKNLVLKNQKYGTVCYKHLGKSFFETGSHIKQRNWMQKDVCSEPFRLLGTSLELESFYATFSM